MNIEQKINALLERAVAGDKDDAMRFSQAALNAAHAAQVLEQIGKDMDKAPTK